MEIGFWAILPMAVALDLILGDPAGWPHPVRWMGMAIDRLEPHARRLSTNEVTAGLLFAAGLTAAAAGITWTVVALAAALHPILGAAVETVIVYWCISIRSLKQAALDVYRLLRAADRTAARGAVAMIVGRDTRDLDETGISRAAVETVAENLVDGVISPICYAAIGGAPLAAAFKMVSTLDSMIGYRNRRYARFGKAAARMDDGLNYIPARLSVALIAAGAQMLGRRGRQAAETARTDGGNHLSPNAGLPEAAFAGALGVRLGGPSTYHGKTVEKPFIGGQYRAAVPVDIPRACALMVTSALFSVPAALLIHAGLCLLAGIGGGGP